MRIHHLNCISSCALGGRLMDTRTPGIFTRAALACHCLLLEAPQGLVLVDTGYGMADVLDPRNRLSRFFLTLLSPDWREEMTAVRQIERLGYGARDVRHIVLTHLDFDHAGGLDDFPEAAVHLLRQEWDSASQQKTWLDRQRFRPQQWNTRVNWRFYAAGSGERWNGFECVHGLEGVPPEVLLVPLPGHTDGHAGVAVDRGAKGWLLQAGDAYFHHAEMRHRPWCPFGLRMYQALMEKNRSLRLSNQQRLRELANADGGVQLCCAHDPDEFERIAGRPLADPLPWNRAAF